MSLPHYNVVFATPGHSMKSEYVKSLLETVDWLVEEKMSYIFLSKYSSFVPAARELTATNTFAPNWETNQIGSGEFTYDKIFWIDSDISWDEEAFVQLLDSDKDIIGGLYQTGRDGRVAVNIWDEKGRPTVVNKVEFLLHTEPVKVDGLGFGFICMKSGVFEAMPRPWFKILEVEVEGSKFPINLGEDYSWCLSAQKAGFDIWVDPMVKVEHHKEIIYTV